MTPSPADGVGHQHGQRHRIVFGVHAVLEVVLHRAAVGGRHHELVLDQDVVELGALEVFSHFDVEVAGEVTPAVAPVSVPFVGDEVQEPSQMKPVGHNDNRSREALLQCVLTVPARLRYAVCAEQTNGHST